MRDVVEEIEDPETEMTLEEAREVDPNAEIGAPVKLDELDTSQLGRIAAQSARQVLFQRVREAERAVVYRNYADRIDEMINGIVKRIDRGSIIVELGDTEGIIPRNHQVRHERYSQGDRIRSVVVDVTMDASRPQVVLSRTDPAAARASCSRWRCRRSTTAPWSSRSASASPASGPRWPSSPRTATSIRSAPASA